jgi:hypothetical protein
MPVPTRKVELGFDGNGPGNFFTLDSPTAGVLDGTAYVLGGAAYYDVTEYVKSISINRGKSRELDRFNAGSANIQFNNQNRFFDPTNTSSPFYGQIVPRREVRVSCNYTPATTVTRTNLVTNPSLENNTTNWTGSSTTLSRVTSDSFVGSASLQVTNITLGGNRGVFFAFDTRMPVTAGQQYTASAYIKNIDANATDFRATIRWYNASGNLAGSTTAGALQTINSGGWTRVNATGTALATAVSAHVLINTPSSWNGGTSILVDAALFEESSSVNNYFSGSSANISTSELSRTYAWSGTANASTSTEVSVFAEFGVQFYGLVDDWNLDYNISGLSDASLTAFDGFSKLAGQALTAGTATVQLSGARINAVLSDSGVQWPTTARAIDAGGQTLQADVVATGTNVMQYINTIEQSEPGIFFIDKSGNATFRDRNRLYASSNAVVLSDDGTGIPYGDIKVNYGSELLYNQAEISRLNGGVAVADDLLSQQTYGVRSYEASDLLMNTDDALGQLAIFLVNQYASPEYRFESLTVLMSKLSQAQQNSILGLEIGSICRIKFQPNKIGAVIDKYAQVIGIQNQMSISDHKVTLAFQTIDTAYFVLDDPAFGLLDYNTLGF